jgi:hypothetical protein
VDEENLDVATEMALNPRGADPDKWKNLKQAPGVITTTIQKTAQPMASYTTGMQ